MGTWNSEMQRISRHDLESGLREWYVNAPLGLEQGFTLERPPVGGDRDRAEIEIALEGGWRAASRTGGRTLSLHAPEGNGRLRYGQLAAWDASGRELDTEMRVED